MHAATASSARKSTASGSDRETVTPGRAKATSVFQEMQGAARSNLERGDVHPVQTTRNGAQGHATTPPKQVRQTDRVRNCEVSVWRAPPPAGDH